MRDFLENRFGPGGLNSQEQSEPQMFKDVSVKRIYLPSRRQLHLRHKVSRREV